MRLWRLSRRWHGEGNDNIRQAGPDAASGLHFRKAGKMMFAERTGFIIWVSDLKAARNLDKYGTVHYISRRMHYVVMYVNADRADDTMKNVKRLSYVRKIERSYRNEIKTEYASKTADKTSYYGL